MEGIPGYLRALGILEQLFIHQQARDQFLQERGITELGRGGEGTVYFLRGHVVKLFNRDGVMSALREIAHMLYLNRTQPAGGAMGDRARQDWPALLWVYALSDGSIAIGMTPFDKGSCMGSTLEHRLALGPSLDRCCAIRMLRSICRSMVFAHTNGIIHHDLKPANIYIPALPEQEPVVFDLGQALWRQASWGRQWRRHEHNLLHWYNGTFRYMHYQRRLAHRCALASTEQHPPTAKQTEAFHQYMPSYYDDVFAFARIMRDVIRSKHVQLECDDRKAIKKLYCRLMGLYHASPFSADSPQDSGLLRRIRLAFAGKADETPEKSKSDPYWMSMAHVLPELEQTFAPILSK